MSNLAKNLSKMKNYSCQINLKTWWTLVIISNTPDKKNQFLGKIMGYGEMAWQKVKTGP